MVILNAYSLSFAFGNVIGFLLFLAPIPTFYTIHQKKTSDRFQSIPYIVVLSSAMLLLYYELIKTDATMIININAVGCVIEVTYLVLFVFYASKQEKMTTLKMVLLFNVGCILILSMTMFLLKERQRVNILNWICSTFSIAVLTSPLSIMAKIVRTKRVKFMPISLLLFLVLYSTSWFLYGLLMGDIFIVLPNIIGFLLGITQTILYMIYKDAKTNNDGAKEKQINNVKLTEPISR